MDIYSTIHNQLQNLCQTKFEAAWLFVAQVSSVQQDSTCTIRMPSGMELAGVRLRAVVNDDKDQILVTPKQHSHVLVADFSGGNLTDLAVIKFSRPQAIDINIGSSTVHIEDGQIEFNGGDNGGLINITDLTGKLNTIERDLNALKTTLAGWTPVPQDGGAALKAAITTWATQQLQLTQNNDYQDNKIKH